MIYGNHMIDQITDAEFDRLVCGLGDGDDEDYEADREYDDMVDAILTSLDAEVRDGQA